MAKHPRTRQSNGEELEVDGKESAAVSTNLSKLTRLSRTTLFWCALSNLCLADSGNECGDEELEEEGDDWLSEELSGSDDESSEGVQKR